MMKIVRKLVGPVCGWVIGFMLPRILISAGIPLDVWAAKAGSVIGPALSNDMAVSALSILVAFIFAGVEAWFRPTVRLWTRLVDGSASQTSASSDPVEPNLMTFVAFLVEAEAAGWRMDEPPRSMILELIDEMRQAGVFGTLVFWGRPSDGHMSLSLIQRNPLQKIPAEHWYDFSFDWIPAMEFGKGPSLETVGVKSKADNLAVSSRASLGNSGFHDIHVDSARASAWLKAHSPPRDNAG